jgi:hypothetical protein
VAGSECAVGGVAASKKVLALAENGAGLKLKLPVRVFNLCM